VEINKTYAKVYLIADMGINAKIGVNSPVTGLGTKSVSLSGFLSKGGELSDGSTE
jgi:hypothetical protein